MFSEKFRGPARPFQITIGLTEGYGGNKHYTPEEVLNVIDAWMKKRMKDGLPVLTGGMLVKGPMLYAWNSNATGIQTNQEDSVIFFGDVNPLYSADLSDAEVVVILKDLASFVGERLNQTRMYSKFKNELIIQQNDRAIHPTEKK